MFIQKTAIENFYWLGIEWLTRHIHRVYSPEGNADIKKYYRNMYTITIMKTAKGNARCSSMHITWKVYLV